MALDHKNLLFVHYDCHPHLVTFDSDEARRELARLKKQKPDLPWKLSHGPAEFYRNASEFLEDGSSF